MSKTEIIKALKVSAMAGVLFLFAACAGQLDSYDLYVQGQLDAKTLSITGKRILVYTKKGSEGLLLKSETKEKINKALANHGYIPAENLSNADYVMLFEYGMDTEKAVSSTETSYKLNPINNRLESSRSTNTEMLYTKHLTLKLFSSKRLSKTSQPVWRGRVESSSSDSNLRRSIDYLVAAAFSHFGKDTAGKVFLTIDSEDEKIKGLMISPP